MNTHVWKKISRLTLVIGIVSQSSLLHAQTTFPLPEIGTAGSGSTAVDLEFRLDGSILEKGAGTSTLSNADLEVGSRFIWYPAQSALRAGAGLSTETVGNIGQYSVAMGNQNTASGSTSMAMGALSIASGPGSFALGYSTRASNYNTVALNEGTIASGNTATAMGASTTAAGDNSLAAGYFALASGGSSVATGSYTSASGNDSTAAGLKTTANSDASFAIGAYNLGLSETGATPNLNSWVSTDPLFEIGNGTGSGATPLTDALVIYKDGNAAFPAATSTVAAATFVTTKASGDIPMYTGN